MFEELISPWRMRDDALIKCGVWGAIAVVALLIAPGKLSSCENAHLLCNTRELPRGGSVVRSITIKTTTKLAGIDHGLPDHL